MRQFDVSLHLGSLRSENEPEIQDLQFLGR